MVSVVVAGFNPTSAGEGKSTTTIGVCQALGDPRPPRHDLHPAALSGAFLGAFGAINKNLILQCAVCFGPIESTFVSLSSLSRLSRLLSLLSRLSSLASRLSFPISCLETTFVIDRPSSGPHLWGERRRRGWRLLPGVCPVCPHASLADTQRNRKMEFF